MRYSKTKLLFLAILMGLSVALTGCGSGSATGADTTGGDTGGGSGSGGGGSGSGSDTNPPAVTSTKPANGGVAVSAPGTLVADFNEALDANSINNSSMTLTGPSGDIGLSVKMSGNKELVATPSGSLRTGTAYTVTVSKNVKDSAGNPLGQDYVWQFSISTDMCANVYNGGFDPVIGKDSTPPGSMSKPTRAVPFADPAYSSCVIRATDAANEPPVGFARNDYSRREPFNADDSLYLIYAQNGHWHIYKTADTSYVRELNLGGGSTEPQWDPNDPNSLYIFPNNGGMTISKYNVMTDQKQVVADFTNVASIAGHPGMTSIKQIWPSAARAWTRDEGSPSANARYWGLMVEDVNFNSLGLITYDMQTDTITGVYDYATDGNGIGRPDHVSMSPTGQYVVPSWNGGNTCSSASNLGTLHNPCGLMSFKRDFSSAVGLAQKGPHSDIALDASGNDVIVISNYDSGYLEMHNLATGQKTNLWQIYINGSSTAMHISGKAFKHPGWVLVSTYAGSGTEWYTDEVMAVELKANPRIYNLAHTYNIANTYFSETHAAVNRTFTRMLFNSNWNTGDVNQVDAYMISLPANTIPPGN